MNVVQSGKWYINRDAKQYKDYIKKLSKAIKGRKLSPEACRNMSLSKMGNKNPMFGKHHTEEFKQQKSLAMKGRKITWKNALKKARRLRSLKVYNMIYTIKNPQNEIIAISTRNSLKKYLQNYNKTRKYKFEMVGVESLVKHKNWKDFSILKIVRQNCDNKKEFVCYEV